MDGAESSSESEAEQDESEEETQKTVIAFICFMNHHVLRNIKSRLNAVLPLWSLCMNKKRKEKHNLGAACCCHRDILLRFVDFATCIIDSRAGNTSVTLIRNQLHKHRFSHASLENTRKEACDPKKAAD